MVILNGVDVVLVNPGYGKQFSRVAHQAYPLGLGYLAAVLETAGYRSRVLDLGLEDISTITSISPKIVGISVDTPVLREAYDIVNFVKTTLPDTKIVVGGSHITADPGILSALDVKFGFRGEAEESIVKVCEEILRGDVGNIRGVVTNISNTISKTNIHYVKDLDRIPHPKREPKISSKYKRHSMIMSRGCPYSCVYCSVSNTPVRFRSADNVLSELVENVRRYNIREIDFVDDVFTLDYERVLSLCEGLQKQNLKIHLACTTRADLVDFSLLKEMYKSGFKHISFGVESGVESVREALGKNISNSEYERVFDACKQLGIKTRAYIMLGNPTETKQDMEKTALFIRRIKPDDVVFHITDVTPNSRLYSIMKDKGQIEDNVWVDFMLGRIEYPVFIPDALNEQEILDFYNSVCSDFYLSRQNIIKVLREHIGI